MGDADFDTGAVADRISDVTISGFPGNGVFVPGGEDVKIWHNDLVDNGDYGAAAFFSTGTVFTENRATGSDEAGLYVGSSPDADAEVQDNVVRDNGIGLFVRDADHGRIRDNRARDNTEACPAGEEGGPISGIGVAILGASDASSADDGGGVPTGNVIRHNVVLDNEPADLIALAGDANRTDNRCRTSQPPSSARTKD